MIQEHKGIPETLFWRLYYEARKQGTTIDQLIANTLGNNVPRTTIMVDTNPREHLQEFCFRVFGTTRYWHELLQVNDLSLTEIEPPLLPSELLVPGHLPRRFTRPWYTRPVFYLTFESKMPREGIPHPGLDFSVGFKGAVRAPADGKVVLVMNDPGGYGLFTMLQHETPGPEPASISFLYTLFAHLDFVACQPGDILYEGMVVGSQGISGNAGKYSHVHYEVKKSRDLGLIQYLKEFPEDLDTFFFNPATVTSEDGVLFVPLT